MGVTHTVSVVYGVKETKAMRAKRNVTWTIDLYDCGEGHVKTRWESDAPKFCPTCGKAVQKMPGEVDGVQDPVHAYAPAELDPENNGHHYDKVINDYVHIETQMTNDADVVLGLRLIHKYSREDSGAFTIPDPTPDQKKAVHAYLDHLGLDPNNARTYLLVGGS
jgi:hypothetical protein